MGDHRPDERHAAPPRKGGAGGGRGPRTLAAALLLACVGGIGYFALHDRAPTPHGNADARHAASSGAAAGTHAEATAMPREPLDARRAQPRPAADDLASVIVPGTPVPTMGDVIDFLNAKSTDDTGP